MRRTAWRWLALAGLAAVFMVGITLFSAQEGAVSSGLSRGVLELVEQYLPGIYRLLAATGRPEFALRKLAHFTEYAALGLCLYALARRRLAPLPALALALGMAVAFAFVDEWHQLSVPGRDGSLRDVGIDSLGALAGVLLGRAGTALRHLRG